MDEGIKLVQSNKDITIDKLEGVSSLAEELAATSEEVSARTKVQKEEVEMMHCNITLINNKVMKLKALF